MAQQLIVGLIVLAAALSAVWRWMPAGWRRIAARQIAAGTRRAGLVGPTRADQFAAALARSTGCGACDSCGACGTAGKSDTKKVIAGSVAGMPSTGAMPDTSAR